MKTLVLMIVIMMGFIGCRDGTTEKTSGKKGGLKRLEEGNWLYMEDFFTIMAYYNPDRDKWFVSFVDIPEKEWNFNHQMKISNGAVDWYLRIGDWKEGLNELVARYEYVYEKSWKDEKGVEVEYDGFQFKTVTCNNEKSPNVREVPWYNKLKTETLEKIKKTKGFKGKEKIDFIFFTQPDTGSPTITRGCQVGDLQKYAILNKEGSIWLYYNTSEYKRTEYLSLSQIQKLNGVYTKDTKDTKKDKKGSSYCFYPRDRDNLDRNRACLKVFEKAD